MVRDQKFLGFKRVSGDIRLRLTLARAELVDAVLLGLLPFQSYAYSHLTGTLPCVVVGDATAFSYFS